MSVTRGFLGWLVCVSAMLVTGMPLRAADTNDGQRITVGAAADLSFALNDIVEEFYQEHPGAKVNVSYGSSGNLFAQINNGAPYDLFLSADVGFPRRLIADKKAATDGLFLYAVGRVVVWVPKDSPIDVEKLGIEALLAPTVRKIAIANPAHAPYGRAAVAAMKTLGVYEKVSDRLVLGENIAQTTEFVESGAADIGLIALSLAVSPKMKGEGRYWEVPLDAYPRLEQGGVVLSASKQPELANQFRALLVGPQGRETLRRYGFILPE
ncbi:MAG TPA: molybdate ABC transporter substrate-binding protein [Verrucomicrobiae bacterium]|nr:molybdate ABC transporter substrate-binding protein [Verrucomicrobiae bacterium]